uniref:Alcohol dehydrogenase n=1 Tax=Knipowitschia caucasica TaxID=637954 RepID=A0AAV2MGH8_KNICA
MSTPGTVIECKAAVAWEPGKPLKITTVKVHPPKDHEVRIKMLYAGVCHTDWSYLYHGGQQDWPFPLVLGHEGAGVVESVGPQVTKVSPGDQVIPLFLPECGTCAQCRSGKTNMCRNNWAQSQKGVMADGTSRVSCNQQQVYQFLGVSCLSQYTVVSDAAVARIRADAPLETVCLLGCGVSTGYGAALNAAKVQRGSTCAVFGLGAVGLAAVVGCRAAGASRIIAVDSNSQKTKKALALGATEFINPQEPHKKPVQDQLREMTSGGVDYALECTGDVSSMAQALESTVEAWGVCVVAGCTEPLRIHGDQLLMGRTIKGTYFGGWRGASDLPGLVDKYMKNKKDLSLETFITKRLRLEDVNTALQLLRSGDSPVRG